MSVAIYALFRALEFGWNLGEMEGVIWGKGGQRPWWFGSWMLSPLAFGQLMHAAVFDRDCFTVPKVRCPRGQSLRDVVLTRTGLR